MLAEAIDTEKLVEQLYESEGTQQLTYMLAAAVYDSKTVRELGEAMHRLSLCPTHIWTG